MLSILINLIFVSGFSFLLIIILEYVIYLWENKKVTDLTKDILPDHKQSSSDKFEFTRSNYSMDNFNSIRMKNPINNKYFERSIVLVKSQDYKGWSEKAIEIAKKVAGNIGLYSQKAVKLVLSLSKSGNNFPDHEEKHIKTDLTSTKINETAAKISEISEKDNPSADLIIPQMETNSISAAENSWTNDSELATLNLANNIRDQDQKDTTTYDKIEKSILTKLQETGLNHYDIWLELGQFYQKYNENEKAKEIFAMVMKHAEGKDKEMARDGLIALS